MFPSVIVCSLLAYTIWEVFGSLYVYELCVYILLNSSAYCYLPEHLSELLYDLIEFDAQSVGASTSDLCRTERHRFDPRPKPDTCVSSFYLVLCEFALLFCLLVLHNVIA